MGRYGDPSNLRRWALAKKFTLCDNFFMGAPGGLLLNHLYLVAARPPFYPNALSPDFYAVNIMGPAYAPAFTTDPARRRRRPRARRPDRHNRSVILAIDVMAPRLTGESRSPLSQDAMVSICSWAYSVHDYTIVSPLVATDQGHDHSFI